MVEENVNVTQEGAVCDGNGRPMAAPTDAPPAESAAVGGVRPDHGAQAAGSSARDEDIAAFREVFPDAAADPASIPKEVWDSVREGRSLVASYAVHAARKANAEREALQRELAALRLERENARRSTGSLSGALDAPVRKDAFSQGWEG